MTDTRTRPGALYLLTPPRIDDPAAFTATLGAVLATGHVAALQLRFKTLDPQGVEVPSPDADWHRLAPPMIALARRSGVTVLLNDRADLVTTLGADGVHLGQQDGDLAHWRAALGRDAVIGVTCHDSRHLGLEAAEAGADYVAFGAFFDTATKTPKSHANPEILEWWSQMIEVPCVAIGGITAENCGPLIRAGADFCAVTGAVWDHPDGPVAGVEAYMAARERALS